MYSTVCAIVYYATCMSVRCLLITAEIH